MFNKYSSGMILNNSIWQILSWSLIPDSIIFSEAEHFPRNVLGDFSACILANFQERFSFRMDSNDYTPHYIG